jgi:hypothetical protein
LSKFPDFLLKNNSGLKEFSGAVVEENILGTIIEETNE